MIIKVKNEMTKIGEFVSLEERYCFGWLREGENGGESGFFSWQEKAADAIHIPEAELDMRFGVQAGAFECGATFGEGASYCIEGMGG